jgi:hypothetical protein
MRLLLKYWRSTWVFSLKIVLFRVSTTQDNPFAALKESTIP